MSVPQRSQRSGSWESKQWHVFSAEMGKIMMHREKNCAAIPCTSTPTDALSWHIITGSKHNNIDTKTHKHISRPQPSGSSPFCVTPFLMRHKVKTYKLYTITEEKPVIQTATLSRSARPCGLALFISFLCQSFLHTRASPWWSPPPNYSKRPAFLQLHTSRHIFPPSFHRIGQENRTNAVIRRGVP